MASNNRKSYGFFNFIIDIILTCLTGGLWLIWIFCREMRR
ncbi:membrane protein [Gordonia phage OlgasClover]|nr:membrane protein [Gordonia phage AlainaMarie]WNT45151.1 membrane protein [Gordonia phage OlgasClover]